MAKKRNKAPERFGGYTTWSIRRTISEAVNVARWSPWHAHAWMEEARDQISLDFPFYDEFDRAADKINRHWVLLTRFPWFDATEFWSLEGEPQEPRLIEKIGL